MPGQTLRRWLLLAVVLVGGCRGMAREPDRLPTGATLDPAGPALALGSMPVAMVFSPDSSRIVAVLSGYREQGIQVIDVASRRVVQTLVQPAAFCGACFSPDARTLFVSGGNQDIVYEYAWRADSAALADSIALGPRPDSTGGRAYPSGLACSPDGARLYVAENLADSLAVVDLGSKTIVQRLAVGAYPYGVIADARGVLYVSAWGGSWVAHFTPGASGLVAESRIGVGRHPSAMALDAAAGRLYVTCAESDRIAVVDTRTDSLISTVDDAAPGGPGEGSTPNALALSPDGRRLYVAEADNNAVGCFATDRIAGVGPETPAGAALLGRVPVEWYPTAVLARGDSLWVLTGKGHGTRPNPTRLQPGYMGKRDPDLYTLGQTRGSLMALRAPRESDLAGLTSRVARANGWDRASGPASLPPFRHVIYMIRENRTYDQVLGDLRVGDGDSSLVFFPRAVTPNAHALAERFGVHDRFFVNGEVSGDGHEWATAAYCADYVEKTVPSIYSHRGRDNDDVRNHGQPVGDDVEDPGNGYLWDLARRAGVSLKNYGEFTNPTKDGRWLAVKPWLVDHTDDAYPGWDLSISDTLRAAHWIAAFREQDAGDSVPALTILWLPNDHTAGGRAASPTPRAYVATNDLSLGRIVEAVSHSRAWPTTVMFVLEDDAQDGPDHVDSHRSPLLVISPYNRPGVRHRFANTTDVLATIDRILHLGSLSQFDHFGRPLADDFGERPDTSGYTALIPAQSLTEVNPGRTVAARLSRRLDLRREDRSDPALFNRVLWLALRGQDPPPGRTGPAPDVSDMIRNDGGARR